MLSGHDGVQGGAAAVEERALDSLLFEVAEKVGVALDGALEEEGFVLVAYWIACTREIGVASVAVFDRLEERRLALTVSQSCRRDSERRQGGNRELKSSKSATHELSLRTNAVPNAPSLKPL